MFNVFKITVSLVSLFVGLMVDQAALAREVNLIALFGDSITIGENSSFPLALRPGRGSGRLGNDGEFPALPASDKLDSLMRQERRNSIVSNWGRGGSNTGNRPGNGAERIFRELQITLNTHPADNYYVLIMYGTNDFGSGLSPSDTEFNTKLMIDRARSAGFVPVIGTITPRIDRNVTPYNSRIVAAAQSRQAPIVDHYARFVQDGNGGLSLLDVEVFNGRTLRLHPTSEGYDVIARTWFDQFLKDAIEPERSGASSLVPVITLLLDE